MKRWKKIAIALALLLLISQVPFAYRRYKLSRLQAVINQLNLERMINADDSLREFKGVLHVHSFLGGHSSGNFDDIIAGAQANSLDFVVMTEHPSKNFDTASLTLRGNHGGVLFLNGNEVALANQERLLLIPGDERAANAGSIPSSEFIAREKANTALTLVAYPQEFKSWGISGYDGVEVYNVFSNTRRINPVTMFFDGLWSYRRYPELLFANFYERPSDNLRLWDQALNESHRRLVATAGNDAHANVGLSLNDSAGKKLLGIQLDPYERSFRLVRMHVLLSRGTDLTADSLLAALREGHCFVAFDLFADATGFRFSATNGTENKIQGDEIALSDSTRLIVAMPLKVRVDLFHNGAMVQQQSGVMRAEFAVKEQGIYRVEVYLTQLPRPVGDQPWIISNPIYVR